MAMLFGKRLFNNRILDTVQKRYGYVVLVPEIGEELPEKNPLSQQDGLPEFNNVTIENCMASIGKQTVQFETDVSKIEFAIQSVPKVDVLRDVLHPMERLGAALDTTWGISKTLYLGNSSLMPTKSYLAIHERAKRARASKYNSVPIYNTAKENVKSSDLTAEEQRVLQKYVLEGKLNGLDLEESKRSGLNYTIAKMLNEQATFRARLDACTKKFSCKIKDPKVIEELPKDVANSMLVNSADSQPSWQLTLQPQIYLPFLEHCLDRELRWNAWQAWVSRCSKLSGSQYETSIPIEEIRALRQNQATILGFKNYAELSMQTKMAGSVDNVKNMLGTMLSHARPAQEKELDSLYQFATEQGFTGERIEQWDLAYWRNRQAKALYDFDESKIQEYFPLGKVLDGLLNLCETLFNITIKRRANVSAWHKDVSFYDVFESHSSAPIAGFYLDPYARTEEKMYVRQNSGWMVGIQNRSRIAETKPLAALIFNFHPATAEKPSLLTFRDLKVLFHKFGQMLQHVLTSTTYSEVSGLSNIEWDAVDVSGYVLSSWLYNKYTLERISSHYLSEDKLPAYMHESLLSMHKHCAGIDLCSELYLSALDIELYSTRDFWLGIMKRLWPVYHATPLHKNDYHVTSFSQIFCEELAAAYYSQIWSRMIAADVYGAFHEVLDQEKQVVDVGKRFRDTFLAHGGSCHPSQVFRNFRGRDPSPKALLASLGLKQRKSE